MTEAWTYEQVVMLCETDGVPLPVEFIEWVAEKMTRAANDAIEASGASEGQAEPVAYMRTYRAYRDDQSAAPDPGVMVTSFHQNHEYAKQVPGENTPLYTHPSAELTALRERIAGMEKDALRYRWLATLQDWNDIENMCWSSTAKSAEEFKHDLDKYIDAAIAKEKQS